MKGYEVSYPMRKRRLYVELINLVHAATPNASLQPRLSVLYAQNVQKFRNDFAGSTTRGKAQRGDDVD